MQTRQVQVFPPKARVAAIAVGVLSGIVLSADAVAGPFPQASRNEHFTFAGNLQKVLNTTRPLATVRGNRALTLWCASDLRHPTAVMADLATGEILWELQHPGDSPYEFWWAGSEVIAVRDDRNAPEVAWLSAETGETRQRISLADCEYVSAKPLNSVLLIDGIEARDIATGELAGRLSERLHPSTVIEGRKHICGHLVESPQILVLAESEECQEIGRVVLGALPELKQFGPHYWWPKLINDSGIVIVESHRVAEPRHLAAIDVMRQACLWTRMVPPFAPVVLVDDLAADEADDGNAAGAMRSLVMEWSTGEMRLGRRPESLADVASWHMEPPGVLVEQFPHGDLRIVVVHNGTAGHVAALSVTGETVWSRTRPSNVSPFRFAEYGDYGVELNALEIDIFDLQTGETRHRLTADSLGLRPAISADTHDDEQKATAAATLNAGGLWDSISPSTAAGMIALLIVALYFVLRWSLAARRPRPLDAAVSSKTAS